MSFKKLGILGLAASMISVSAVALANTSVKEVKAENETELILTNQQEKFLNIFAKKMHENKDDYYTYLSTWLYDSNESMGLNYFNDFDEEQTEFSAEEVEIAKNSVYFDTLLTTYLYLKNDDIDTIRMYLDHFVPLKEIMTAISDFCSYEVIQEGTEVACDFCRKAHYLYDGLTDILLCTYEFVEETEEEQLAIVYGDFKAYLIDQSEFLKTNVDDTINPYNTYLNIAKLVNTFTGIELSKLEDVADTFIQNFINIDDSSILLDYTLTDVDTWFADPTTYNDEIMTHFDNALRMFFYYFKTVQHMELICPDNYNGFGLINNNIGPSMYKMLDFIDAVKGNEDDGVYIPDYPNVLILAFEIFEDIKGLLTLFTEQIAELIKTDINKYTALETPEYIEWRDVQIPKANSAVSVFDAALSAYQEDGKFDEAIEACEDAEKECDELLAELTAKRDSLKFMSPDMDYILKVVNNLQLKAYTLRKDVAYDKLSAKVDDLTDRYAELVNIKIDSVDTYFTVDEALKNLLWNELFGAALEAAQLSEEYGDEKFKDLLINVDVFVIEALDSVLELHSEVMNLIKTEVNLTIDSINGKADLIYALTEEDEVNVTKLIDETLLLIGELDRLVIALGEYEDKFGVESTLTALKEKEELEYAKVTTLLSNLRGLKKELEIESIVLRGTDFTDATNNLVENEGTVRECDALIEQMNTLITEIDDNFETLGSDERLTQTKAKLNENIQELNSLKDSIESKHTRNVVLIVVGSVLGAALLFVAGFFVSKLLNKKAKAKNN